MTEQNNQLEDIDSFGGYCLTQHNNKLTLWEKWFGNEILEMTFQCHFDFENQFPFTKQ